MAKAGDNLYKFVGIHPRVYLQFCALFHDNCPSIATVAKT